MALTLARLRLRAQLPVPIPRARRDRGSAVTLLGVILGTGAFFGVSALVIDVGQIYMERQELQSGADSAALAVAKNCATAPSTCVSLASSTAAEKANLNAKDGRTRVTAICGTPGTGFGSCPSESTRLVECVGPRSGSYVEVHTATETSDGHTGVGTAFANAAAGDSGRHRTTVGACARASWGAASSGGGLAVTISTCAWNQFTANGTRLAAPPPATPSPAASYESFILLHGTGSTCAAGHSGWNAPGGFGWLDETGGACKATVSVDGSVGGNTGVSASNTCKTALSNARTNRTVLMLPVFDGVLGNGAHATYHIAGLSAFVVTGYALPGFSAASNLTGTSYCGGSSKCIYGYFTTGLLPTGSTSGGGVNYGVSIVKLAG